MNRQEKFFKNEKLSKPEIIPNTHNNPINVRDIFKEFVDADSNEKLKLFGESIEKELSKSIDIIKHNKDIQKIIEDKINSGGIKKIFLEIADDELKSVRGDVPVARDMLKILENLGFLKSVQDALLLYYGPVLELVSRSDKYSNVELCGLEEKSLRDSAVVNVHEMAKTLDDIVQYSRASFEVGFSSKEYISFMEKINELLSKNQGANEGVRLQILNIKSIQDDKNLFKLCSKVLDLIQEFYEINIKRDQKMIEKVKNEDSSTLVLVGEKHIPQINNYFNNL